MTTISDSEDTQDNTIPNIAARFPPPFPTEDPNKPFYLPPSDNSHTIEIKPPLDGTNYTAWSRAFSLSISVKNKQGFLDGSIPAPDFSDDLYIPWLRCNNLILTWLINSVTKEIASSIIYMNSAKEVWDTLKLRYSQPDSVRIYQLQYQLSSAAQGSASISDYFTTLNTIWEELRNYRPFPHCTCGHCTCHALKSICDTQFSDYTFKFLMGLNDSYESTRGQILLMNPIPSLDTVYAMLLQEERQREARLSLLPPNESSALAVGSLQSKRKFKMDVVYQHCGKPGHTIEKCFRIIGFPPNFKFTKGKNANGKTNGPTHSVHSVQAQEASVVTSEQPKLFSFTPEQVQKLMTLLNGDPMEVSQPSATEQTPNQPHFSNMAGSFFKDDDWSC